jgi:hypothetical protein
MKLSDLVKYKTMISNVGIEEQQFNTQQFFKGMMADLDLIAIDLSEGKANIRKYMDEVNQLFEAISRENDKFFQLLQEHIDSYDSEYANISQKVYDDSVKFDSAEYILHRQESAEALSNDHEYKYFIDRIKSYIDWRWPGMELRPAHGLVTEHLKGLDPLYLVDNDEDLLLPIKEKFNSLYQKRLRYYTVSDNDTDLFAQFPKGQFGFVTAFDFFTYKPMHLIRRYFEEIFELLRDGGVLSFTYNNCDKAEGVIKVEVNFACWQPERQIINALKDIGYEIVFTCDQFDKVSWIEARKPGNIQSWRGGQTLGRIVS